MADLVVTCPKRFFLDWIAEGDAAGEPWSGETWGWYLGGGPQPPIEAGDRLYVVAWGRLRGFAPVTDLRTDGRAWCICRQGGAEAVTIGEPIHGFRGWRRRWWPRELEQAFPSWRSEGVPRA